MRPLIPCIGTVIFIAMSTPFNVVAQPTPNQVNAAVKQAGGVELFLQELARQTAVTLPKQLNQNIEMRSAFANGRRLGFMTRLTSINKTDVADLAELKAANVNYAGCSSPVFGVLIREHGVAITYTVIAKGTEYLFEYTLDKKTCKGK